MSQEIEFAEYRLSNVNVTDKEAIEEARLYLEWLKEKPGTKRKWNLWHRWIRQREILTYLKTRNESAA